MIEAWMPYMVMLNKNMDHTLAINNIAVPGDSRVEEKKEKHKKIPQTGKRNPEIMEDICERGTNFVGGLRAVKIWRKNSQIWT